MTAAQRDGYRPNRIQQGDIVSVDFNTAGEAGINLVSRGVVEWVPCATGDSWIVVEQPSGRVHYISEGCTVTKLAARGAP